MSSNQYSHKLRERVVHSSLSEFTSRSPDLSIIGGSVRIGLLIRTGYHPSHQRQMAEVTFESPNVESLTQGEFVELDELDGYTRAKLIEIAQHCSKQGKELIEHSKRLMSIANSEPGSLLSALPSVDDKPREVRETREARLPTPLQDQQDRQDKSPILSSPKRGRAKQVDWTDLE